MNRTEWCLAALCLAVIVNFYALQPLFHVQAYCSAIYNLTHSWTGETNYEHGWFIVPIIVAIFYKNWSIIQRQPSAPSNWGLLFILFAVACFVLSVRAILWRLSVGALPFLAYGIILYLWGRKRASYAIFPLSLFYFCIPVPDLQQATNVLQLFVTKCAGRLAALIGIALEVAGNKVYLLRTSSDFDVNEGCSGIRSLMALLLIAFVYGYFAHQENWKRATIFLSAIPLAIVANIMRIWSILLVADKISVNFAQTIYHDKVGFISFAIALTLLMLLSRILDKGFTRGPRTVVTTINHSPS